jgi:protein-disulfide isomerase
LAGNDDDDDDGAPECGDDADGNTEVDAAALALGVVATPVAVVAGAVVVVVVDAAEVLVVLVEVLDDELWFARARSSSLVVQ